MRVVLPLAWSHLRYRIGQSVVLVLFSAIAAMAATLGLMMAFDYGNDYDAHLRALNVPNVAAIVDPSVASGAAAMAQTHAGVTAVDSEPLLITNVTDVRVGTFNTGDMNVIVADASQPPAFSRLTLVGDHTAPLATDQAYVPQQLRSYAAVGGTINLGIPGGGSTTLTIAGFTDDPWFGLQEGYYYRLYVSHDEYLHLAASMTPVVLVNAATTDDAAANGLETAYLNAYSNTTVTNAASDGKSTQALVWITTDSEAASTYLMMADIVMAVICVSAGLLLIVALVMAWHRSRAMIEQRMADIGVLKAMGHTSGQIATSFLAMVVGCVAAGALVGVGLAHALAQGVGATLAGSTAFRWHPGFAPGASGLGFGLVVLAMAAVTAVTMLRVRRLTPLTALRSGLATHSFRRNHLPLDRSRGPLPLLLGLKQMAQTAGQQITVVVLLAIVTFLAVSATSIYDNMAYHTDRFTSAIAGQSADVDMAASDATATATLATTIAADPKVAASTLATSGLVLVDGTQTVFQAQSDYPAGRGATLLSGQTPRLDNEVVVGLNTSRRLGKGVGDSVTVKTPGEQSQQAVYVVVGVAQSMNNGGNFIQFTIDGIQRIEPDLQVNDLSVWLVDPAQAASWLASFEAAHPGQITASNFTRQDNNLETANMAPPILMVSVTLTVLAGAVIALVIYLLVRNLVWANRRAFGVLKAVGFTSGQIVHQICWTYLPAAVLGILVGTVSGALSIPSIMTLSMTAQGVGSMPLVLPVGVLVGLCAGLIVFAALITVVVAAQVRHISVYRLVADA
ncbi:MAG: ABC transporter permease [Propionibacteriaceae bacterium]|nr:ABC transporter permease [Propionibacteriaceae bacterium]